MKRQPPPKTNAGVALFPFLAVLLCTMGALLVLLVAIARHARETAISGARTVAEVDADVEQARTLWRGKITELTTARDTLAARLAEQRNELSHLEEHTRRIRDELAQAQKAAESLAHADNNDDDTNKKLRARVEQYDAEILALADDVDQMRKAARGQKNSYAIIPYDGPNQTRRRPIYVECRADCVILQPEGIVFDELDFMGSQGPGNPLSASLRAIREFLIRNRMSTPGDDGEPYPLLLVRPDGIPTYYMARNAMNGWGADFGYELIEQDWKLKFKPANLALAAEAGRAVEEARRRQQMIAAAAPRLMSPEERLAYNTALANRHGAGSGASGPGGGGRGFGGGSSAGGGNGVHRTGMSQAVGRAGSRFINSDEQQAASNVAALAPYANLDIAAGGNGRPGLGTGGGNALPSAGQLAGGVTAEGAGGGQNALPQLGGGWGAGNAWGSASPPAGSVAGSGGGAGAGNAAPVGNGPPGGSGAATGNGTGDGSGTFSGSGTPGGSGDLTAGSTGFGSLGDRYSGGGSGGGSSSSNGSGPAGNPGSGNGNGGGNGAPAANPYKDMVLNGSGGSATGNGTGTGSAAASNGSSGPGGSAGGSPGATANSAGSPMGAAGAGGSPSAVGSATTGNLSMNFSNPSSSGGAKPTDGNGAPEQANDGRPPKAAAPRSPFETTGKSYANAPQRPPVGSGGTEARGAEAPSASSSANGSASPSASSKSNSLSKEQSEKLAKRSRSKGRNWALPGDDQHSMPVTRPIQVQCEAGRFIVLSERGDRPKQRVIPIDVNTAESIEPLVGAVWERINSWGIAGEGMYWRPVLMVTIAADGRSRYDDLEAMLYGSGLEVRSKQVMPTASKSLPPGAAR